MKRLIALMVLAAVAIYAYRSSELPALGDAGATLKAVNEELGDARVKASVRAAFQLNRQISAWSVDVAVHDGVVTLSGVVPHPAVKDAASQVAAAVPGTRSVVDNMTLDPALGGPAEGGLTLGETLDDRALEAKVRLAHSLDRTLEGGHLEVRASRRVVTLAGTAQSRPQAERAAAVARLVPDVRAVRDEVRVEGSAQAPPVPPPGPAEAALIALRGMPSLAPYAFETQIRGSSVVLAGRVSTQAEKDLAYYVARDATGLDVINSVQIRP